jgi:hypothetical protein
MKFKLIKDIIVNTTFEGDIKLYESGSTFEPDENGFYTFKGIDGNLKTQTKEDLLNRPSMFEPVNELQLDIKKISPDEDDIVGNYRIQLDVKTSPKRLKEIERVFREVVSNILE